MVMPPYQGCLPAVEVAGEGGFAGCCANEGRDSAAAASAAGITTNDFIKSPVAKLNSTNGD